MFIKSSLPNYVTWFVSLHRGVYICVNASMIKPSCKYLEKVLTKRLVGAFCRIFFCQEGKVSTEWELLGWLFRFTLDWHHPFKSAQYQPTPQTPASPLFCWRKTTFSFQSHSPKFLKGGDQKKRWMPENGGANSFLSKKDLKNKIWLWGFSFKC